MHMEATMAREPSQILGCSHTQRCTATTLGSFAYKFKSKLMTWKATITNTWHHKEETQNTDSHMIARTQLK